MQLVSAFIWTEKRCNLTQCLTLTVAIQVKAFTAQTLHPIPFETASAQPVDGGWADVGAELEWVGKEERSPGGHSVGLTCRRISCWVSMHSRSLFSVMVSLCSNNDTV